MPTKSLSLLLTSAVLLAACKDRANISTPAKVRHVAVHYAQLTSTSESRHQGLRNELALVKAEHGLPIALTSRRVEEGGAPGWQRAGQPILLDGDNAAVAMLESLPIHKRARLRRQLERSYPQNVLQCTPLEIERIADVLENWTAEYQTFSRVLEKPRSDFAVRYTEGLMADLTCVDVAMLGHRLLALHVVDAVTHDQLGRAVEHMDELFRVARLLDDEANLTMRSAAAQLRRESFKLVELMVRHPSVARDQLVTLHNLVDQQLASWPADANVWRGERAIGLHAYETIRDGQILSLLNSQEAKAILDEGPQRFGRAVLKNIDEDELLFLRTMRAMMELSQVPYHQRTVKLAQLEQQLSERREGPDQAFVANLLLNDTLSWGHRVQAADRALTEAWRLGLAAAIEDSASASQSVQEPPLNPLTGKPFRIVYEDTRVEVSGLNGVDEGEPIWNEPLMVPRSAR